MEGVEDVENVFNDDMIQPWMTSSSFSIRNLTDFSYASCGSQTNKQNKNAEQMSKINARVKCFVLSIFLEVVASIVPRNQEKLLQQKMDLYRTFYPKYFLLVKQVSVSFCRHQCSDLERR